MPALERLVQEQLTVQNVVAQDLELLSPDEGAEIAGARLRSLNYDVAGVRIGDRIEHVLQRDLRDGTVADHARPISSNEVIEKTLPIVPLIMLFKKSQRYFVLDGHQVRWIVTTADLKAPAVSIAVLSHLIALEEVLRYLVIQDLGSAWFETLSVGAQEKAREVYEHLRSENAETGLQYCIRFGDCISLAQRARNVPASLGFDSPRALKRACGFMDRLRNDLAHGRSILDKARSLDDAIGHVNTIRTVAGRAWEAVRVHDASIAGTTVLGDRKATVTGPVGSHIVSALNPGGLFLLPEENAARHERLSARLGVSDRWSVDQVRTVSSSGSWDEPAFHVIGASDEDAFRLASEFGQSSVFRFVDDGVVDEVPIAVR